MADTLTDAELGKRVREILCSTWNDQSKWLEIQQLDRECRPPSLDEQRAMRREASEKAYREKQAAKSAAVRAAPKPAPAPPAARKTVPKKKATRKKTT